MLWSKMYSHHSLYLDQLLDCDGRLEIPTPSKRFVKCNAILFLCSTKPLCGEKMVLFVKRITEVNEANKAQCLAVVSEREMIQAK